MARTVPTFERRVGLIDACDDARLFGVDLTPRQRELLVQVEAGDLLHAWALGRRSGKTLLAALTALWFCLLRPDLAGHVRRRERRYSVGVAVNLRQSRVFLEQARSIVEASSLLAPLIESVTDDEIRFKNRTALAAFPCTSRGGRGWPIHCLLLDEAAHMLDGDGNQAADPVYRSLVPSTAQFGAAARVIVASSPYGVDGFFSDLYHRAERGELDGAVAAHASTMEARPGFATAALELERQRDPDGFRAEYLGEFVAAGGAFLDAGQVSAATAGRDHELAPGGVDGPVAGLDLAFTHDSSALVIVGRAKDDARRLVLVLARAWVPSPGAPLSPGVVLDEIAALCHLHGVRHVYLDQFNAASAREHLQRARLQPTVVATSPTSKSAMFADLKQRLYEGRVELYEQPELLAELRRVETVTTPGQASVRIRRLGASHGDLATALALACSRLRGAGPSRVYTGLGVARGHIGDAARGQGAPARAYAHAAAREAQRDRDLAFAAQLGIPISGDPWSIR